MSTPSTTGRADASPVLTAGTAFRLDGWLVEPSLNRFAHGGAVVHVRPQLVDLLVCLAARPGQVVSKDRLLSTVWCDRFVAETAVGRCVCELRGLLEDDAREPRIIETVAKRGYRLMVPVEPVEESVPAPPPTDSPAPGVRPAWRGALAAIARTLAGVVAAWPELARFLARRAG